jgi:hypothetical protein
MKICKYLKCKLHLDLKQRKYLKKNGKETFFSLSISICSYPMHTAIAYPMGYPKHDFLKVASNPIMVDVIFPSQFSKVEYVKALSQLLTAAAERQSRRRQGARGAWLAQVSGLSAAAFALIAAVCWLAARAARRIMQPHADSHDAAATGGGSLMPAVVSFSSLSNYVWKRGVKRENIGLRVVRDRSL